MSKTNRTTARLAGPPRSGAGKGSSARVATPDGRTGVTRRGLISVVLIVVVAIGALFVVYLTSQSSPDEASSESGYAHVSGEPGAGAEAPAFTLPSSTGGEVSLGDFRGESVLLYFQEGLMCQPCWDQITDLENNAEALNGAGIDQVVSITSDPLGHIVQKVADEGLSTPVLSDPDLDVIRAYDAHKYGMMGETRAGHSFILVDPDGTIQWRADYGGAPDYTMYLPTEALLADLVAERIS